jgi:electron transfer flavoprotein beta subunit
MLGLPMVSNGKKTEIADDKITVHRQADGCIEVVELALPAVISLNNDTNNPRNASLKGIMAAKRKPIDKKDAGAIGVDSGAIGKAGAIVERQKYETPPAREAGKKFDGDPVEITTQVVDLLVNEAKVIGG